MFICKDKFGDVSRETVMSEQKLAESLYLSGDTDLATNIMADARKKAEQVSNISQAEIVLIAGELSAMMHNDFTA